MNPARDTLYLALTAACLLVTACGPRSPAPLESAGPAAETVVNVAPWDTTYLLDTQPFTLVKGTARLPAAPGSSASITITKIGDAARADLDDRHADDHHHDVAFLVRAELGGSGTFYYVAAARNVEGAYRGTNLVLIGDRIVPQGLTVRRGVIEVSYLDRGNPDPMSSPPTHPRQAYTLLEGDRLQPLVKLEADEELLDAVVTIGHEVRTLRPCSAPAESWISGKSPALQEIQKAYQSGRADSRPFTPLLMLVTGRLSTDRDGSEFGAAYDTTFTATRLVRALSQTTC